MHILIYIKGSKFVQTAVYIYIVSFQDVCEGSCLKYPKLYEPGQLNALFNVKVFLFSLLFGTATSLGIFFLTYGSLGFSVSSIGLETSSQFFFGTAMSAILVIVVNVEVGASWSTYRFNIAFFVSLLID